MRGETVPSDMIHGSAAPGPDAPIDGRVGHRRPRISSVVRFIREHACEGITVADVLAGLPLSRSVFELHRFVKIFGLTPKAEILRAPDRSGRSGSSLRPSLPCQQIASRTGFHHPEYLSAAFKERTSQTPGQYRRSAQQR